MALEQHLLYVQCCAAQLKYLAFFYNQYLIVLDCLMWIYSLTSFLLLMHLKGYKFHTEQLTMSCRMVHLCGNDNKDILFYSILLLVWCMSVVKWQLNYYINRRICSAVNVLCWGKGKSSHNLYIIMTWQCVLMWFLLFLSVPKCHTYTQTPPHWSKCLTTCMRWCALVSFARSSFHMYHFLLFDSY